MDNQMNQYDNGGGYNNGGRGNMPGGNGGNGNGNQPPRRPNLMMVLLAGLSTVLLVFMLWNLLFGSSGNTQEVSYTKFLEYVNSDKVEAVEVQSTGQVLFTLKEEGKKEGTDAPGGLPGYSFYGNLPVTYSTIIMEDLDTLTARLEAHDIDGTRVLSDNSGRILDILLYVVLPVILMWILLGVVFKKMGGAGGPLASSSPATSLNVTPVSFCT